MGFKRTSEGRVFFQGADDASAARKADFRTAPSSSGPASAPPSSAASGQPATQLQILTLLRALNDKLKDSQAERSRMRTELNTYRQQIQELEQKVGKNDKGQVERAEKLAEDTFRELQETRKLLLEIEDKTERADKATQTLQRQIGQTRALGEEVARRQETYEELVKRLDVNDTRYEDLNQKVEKANAEQARILRQIEKVAEDRVRFMRKIERIEETVIQTRDALSAKAMVLLTEQGAAARSDAAPSLIEQITGIRPRAEKDPGAPAWWQTPRLFQAGVAASVLVLGIFGGWAVSKIQENSAGQSSFDASSVVTSSADDNAAADASQTAAAGPGANDEANTGNGTDAADTAEAANGNAADDTDMTPLDAPAAPQPSSDASASSQFAPVPAAQQNMAASDDIGTLDVKDEKKLAQMLDENPDAVAAALNRIEPGAVPANAAADTGDNATQMAEAVAPEAVPRQTPKAQENVTPPPVAKTETPAAAPEAPRPAAPDDVKPAAIGKALSPEELAGQMSPDNSLPPQAKEIEKQAFAGVPEAQHDLAAIYTAGQGGVQQDYKRAAFWFRQAADQGIANARYNLGVLYHQGLGVKPDIKEAIRWYKSAAALGHPEAQYNLGIAYIEGIGVGYDPARAAQNFESAAKQGIMEAAYNLGLIYENGLLGKADPAKALSWYKSAADQGSPEAKEALEQLAKTLNIKVEDVNRVADEAKPAKKS